METLNDKLRWQRFASKHMIESYLNVDNLLQVLLYFPLLYLPTTIDSYAHLYHVTPFLHHPTPNTTPSVTYTLTLYLTTAVPPQHNPIGNLYFNPIPYILLQQSHLYTTPSVTYTLTLFPISYYSSPTPTQPHR